MEETSVKNKLMGIESQLSKLIGDPRLHEVSIWQGGPSHPDSGICRLDYDIHTREELLDALNKILKWIRYIIAVIDTNH